MTVDLLNMDNYVSYNIKVAQTLGLHISIYIQLLFSIWQKADRKKSLVENKYIKVDRDYITFMTTFSTEEQLKLDGVLSKLGIIKKNTDDKDLLELDMTLYAAIISSSDETFLNKLKSKVSVKDTRESKEIKRQNKSDKIRECLKTCYKCSNLELSNAINKWIDSVLDKPSGENYMTKENVLNFQTSMNTYTKGDLDLALSVLKIATEHGFKYFDYAKNTYEKQQKQKQTLRVTRQERVTSRAQLSSVSY